MTPQEFVENIILQKNHTMDTSMQEYQRERMDPPKAVRIVQDTLVKNLETYVYHPTRKNTRLWKHNSQPISFTLVADNFGVKYSGKEHALHLKTALETKNKVTTDW